MQKINSEAGSSKVRVKTNGKMDGIGDFITSLANAAGN